MPGHSRPRMSTQDYLSYLDRAAAATSPMDVERLRGEVLERWRDDPWAADLDQALHLHHERLAARENRLRSEAGRSASRVNSHSRRPPA